MLDKLFVRVRSWLHNDPTGVLGDPGLGAPLAGRARNGANGVHGTNGKGNGNEMTGAVDGKPAHTPPPLPPDAWAESESGMVITESGIIILDPAAVEAHRASPPSRPPLRGVPADTAWAVPSLPRPGATSPVPAPMSAASTTTSSSANSDWDQVLARARAQINGTNGTNGSPSDATNGSTSGQPTQPGSRKAGSRK